MCIYNITIHVSCIIIYIYPYILKYFRFTSSYSHSIHRKPKIPTKSTLHLATGPNAGQGAASQTYLGARRRNLKQIGSVDIPLPGPEPSKKMRVELVVVGGNYTRISCFTKITSNYTRPKHWCNSQMAS